MCPLCKVCSPKPVLKAEGTHTDELHVLFNRKNFLYPDKKCRLNQSYSSYCHCSTPGRTESCNKFIIVYLTQLPILSCKYVLCAGMSSRERGRISVNLIN